VPTVLKWRGWIFLFYSADWRELFYSADWREPPHVHARKGRQEAKFWLSDCSVAASRRVSHHELGALQRKVREQQEPFLESWHAHFR
jgi:Domain of unknown function (DUF4160)